MPIPDVPAHHAPAPPSVTGPQAAVLRSRIDAILARYPVPKAESIPALCRELLPRLIELYDALYGTTLATRRELLPTLQMISEPNAARDEEFRLAWRVAGATEAMLPQLLQTTGTDDTAAMDYAFLAKVVRVYNARLASAGASAASIAAALFEELLHQRQAIRYGIHLAMADLSMHIMRRILAVDLGLPIDPKLAVISEARRVELRRTMHALHAWTEGEPTWVRAKLNDEVFFGGAGFGTLKLAAALERRQHHSKAVSFRAEAAAYERGTAAFRLAEEKGIVAELQAAPWKVAFLLQPEGELWVQAADVGVTLERLNAKSARLDELRDELHRRYPAFVSDAGRLHIQVIAAGGAPAAGCLLMRGADLDP